MEHPDGSQEAASYPDISQTLSEVGGSHDDQAQDLDATKAVQDKDCDSDDNEQSSEEESGEDASSPVKMVGGKIDMPAFCLLAGMEVSDDGNHDTISIPITRLPATLGRSHDAKDNHFFGVGNLKALSRQQCIISFQNSTGTTLGQIDKTKDSFSYKQSKELAEQEVICSKDQELPSSGFFVIKCVGKNRILVNGQKIEQGQTALLQHGTPIRMSSFCLYFLLPSDATKKTMSVPLYPPKKSNKRKASTSTNDKTALPAAKKPKAPTKTASMAAELEALPLDKLLSRMTEAVESNQWDRRHQMIGSAISLHAVQDAARAPAVRALAQGGKGVARSDVMAWIKENPIYSKWVTQMLGKMELKSYQSNVSKALAKAGYVRTGTTGRHVKWILPKSEQPQEEESDEDDSSEDDSSEGDNKAGGVQNEVAADNSERSSGDESDESSGNDDNDIDENQDISG